MPARSEREPAPAAAREETTPTGLTVVEMDPQVDPRWQAFVMAHPRGTVYHHPAWLSVLKAEYDQRSLHLACLGRAGQVLGVLPLLYTRGVPLLRGHLTRRRLSSLPRTPVAGPLTAGPLATTALLREAVRRIQQDPGLLLQVKLREPPSDDVAAGMTSSRWRQSYVLELPRDPGSVRFGASRNHTRIKAGVKKASHLGVRVRTAETLEDLAAWYRLYLDTMRAHVVPPRPFRLFEAMWSLLRPGNMMRLLLAHREGPTARSTILAGSILLMSGDTVFYAFSGRAREHLWMRPNDVIQWEAVHQAAADGFRYYDLGEVPSSNRGLADFKKKWGADAQQLYRYHYPPLVHADDSVESSGLSRKIFEAGWRRLPNPVTAALGQQLYRYL